MSIESRYSVSASDDEIARLSRSWGWLIVFGVVLALTGALAIAYPVAATVTTVELFGILLLIGGFSQIAAGVLSGRAGGFLLHLMCGLFTLFLGLILLDRPLLGAAGYTLVMAVFFFATGISRVVYALANRFSGWGWVLLNGGIAVVLGMMIWREFPESALWVIGTFVGIDLVLNGLSWTMVALSVRRIMPRPAARSDSALVQV